MEWDYTLWECDSVADYLSVLQEQGVESVLLVSHLPLVGSIVSELMASEIQSVFTLQRLFKLTGMVKKAPLKLSIIPKKMVKVD